MLLTVEIRSMIDEGKAIVEPLVLRLSREI